MAQSVGDHDLEVVKGASLVYEIAYEQQRVDVDGEPVLDSAGEPIYDPIPLGTGWSALMQVRSRSGATVLAEFTTAGGTPTINLTDEGLVTVTIGASITEALTVGKYRYDLRLDGPGDVVVYLVEGKFTVADRITVPV